MMSRVCRNHEEVRPAWPGLPGGLAEALFWAELELLMRIRRKSRGPTLVTRWVRGTCTKLLSMTTSPGCQPGSADGNVPAQALSRSCTSVGETETGIRTWGNRWMWNIVVSPGGI